MDPELHLPTSPGGVGLLLVVLAACGWFFWYMIQRLNKRSQAEGDLDQRLPMILQANAAGWEKLNEKLSVMVDRAESRADKATEERESLMRQFIEYTTSREDVHKQDLEKMRVEKLESDKRIHNRLEECLQRDMAREARDAIINKRLDLLDNRQFNAALVSAPAVVATPVAPTATTFSMPATGFTVTPGVPGQG